MRYALSSGLSNAEQVRDPEAFMPPVATRMSAIILFLEGELGCMQQVVATGGTWRSGAAATVAVNGQGSEWRTFGAYNNPNMWGSEDAFVAAGLDRAAACYRALMARRLEAQRSCRRIENAWNKGVALAV